eukprot:365466-Chlamydomonas_euryale.AAC.13
MGVGQACQHIILTLPNVAAIQEEPNRGDLPSYGRGGAVRQMTRLKVLCNVAGRLTQPLAQLGCSRTEVGRRQIHSGQG